MTVYALLADSPCLKGQDHGPHYELLIPLTLLFGYAFQALISKDSPSATI